MPPSYLACLLGCVCASAAAQVVERVSGRVSASWHDDAIDAYRAARPRLIIAFENQARPGYGETQQPPHRC